MRSTRILVVEDEPHQRAILRRIVSLFDGFEVLVADNGQTALELLEAHDDVAVVVTDLQMPVMDGVELLTRMGGRADPPAVIVVSSEDVAIIGAAGQVAKSMGLKVLGVVEKPVTRAKIGPILEGLNLDGGDGGLPATGIATQLSSQAVRGYLDRDAAVVLLQPKVRLSDRRIVGGEALVRLRSDDGGLISPAAFIASVEADGDLSMDLTLRVAEAVGAFLKSWPGDVPMVPISINLPAACLSEPRLADRLSDIATRYGVPCENIVWEVTETAAIENFAAALGTLTRLRLKRFGLAIDDYGTGHSSLDRLSSLPFTEIKLDQVFVRGAATNSVAQKIIASTAALARDLSLISVAEGAETEEEVNTLQDLGFDVVQGYAISRPLEQAAFVEFAHGRRPGAPIADR